jgi:hypothetical protein
MKLGIYTVHDNKAGAYMQPFFANNAMVAIRMFSDLVNDPEHLFGKHPADFTLFEIGHFDQDSSRIDQPEVHRMLGSGVEFLYPDDDEKSQLPLEAIQ